MDGGRKMCGMTRNHRGNLEVSPCLKWLCFAVNFLFWVLGILMVLNSMYQFSTRESNDLFSATAKAISNKISRFDSGSKEAALANAIVFLGDISVACLCVGTLLIFVTFFGFLGALRENRCLLTVYNTMLFLLIFLEAGGLAYALYRFLIQSKPEEVARKMIQAKVDEYDYHEDVTFLVDLMQSQFQCCGTRVDEERPWNIWHQHPDYTCDTRNMGPNRCSVPASCCKSYLKDLQTRCTECRLKCGRDTLTVGNAAQPAEKNRLHLALLEPFNRAKEMIFITDCATAIQDWVSNSIFVIFAVLGFMIAIQLVAFCAGETLKDQILTCQELYEEDTRRNAALQQSANNSTQSSPLQHRSAPPLDLLECSVEGSHRQMGYRHTRPRIPTNLRQRDERVGCPRVIARPGDRRYATVGRHERGKRRRQRLMAERRRQVAVDVVPCDCGVKFGTADGVVGDSPSSRRNSPARMYYV